MNTLGCLSAVFKTGKRQIDQLPEEMYSMVLAKTPWMMLLILRRQQEPRISAQHENIGKRPVIITAGWEGG